MSSLPPQVPAEQQPSAVPPPILDYATSPIIGLDLKKVAMQQRAIIKCILAEIVMLFVMFAVPAAVINSDERLRLARELLGMTFLAVGVIGALFVFRSAILVYDAGVGILLGVFSLVPCLGLLSLLAVNNRTTAILRRHGIRVGFLGTNPNTILTGDSFPTTNPQ